MESLVKTKRPTLFATSITLLFSYIFIIVGIITNYFNPQDVFLAFIIEGAIILTFIAIKGYISFLYQSINFFKSAEATIKVSRLRLFILSSFLLSMYFLFFFGFLFGQWQIVNALYETDSSVIEQLHYLGGLILIMLGHHAFSFLFNFIGNKEYATYFQNKNNLLIFKLAFNRIFVMHFIMFLFIPLGLLGFTSNFLLIPFVILRYYFDLKAHKESHTPTNQNPENNKLSEQHP